MKQISKALLELRTTLFSIGLFNSLLDSLLVLLVSLLCLILLKMQWALAFIPFGIYFVIHTRKQLNQLGYASVEARVPQLRESLRTAADSVEAENEVVRALQSEVLQKLRLVQTATFIGFGKTTRQLVAIAVLCFLVISVSALDISLFSAPELLHKAGVLAGNNGLLDSAKGLFGRQSRQQDSNAQNAQEVTLTDDTTLYGNSTVIELGTDELNLELNPTQSGIAIGVVNPAEQQEFQEHAAPSDIQATADSAFTEEIPKEYQSIVRNYFKAIPK